MCSTAIASREIGKIPITRNMVSRGGFITSL